MNWYLFNLGAWQFKLIIFDENPSNGFVSLTLFHCSNPFDAHYLYFIYALAYSVMLCNMFMNIFPYLQHSCLMVHIIHAFCYSFHLHLGPHQSIQAIHRTVSPQDLHPHFPSLVISKRYSIFNLLSYHRIWCICNHPVVNVGLYLAFCIHIFLELLKIARVYIMLQ